MSKIILLALSMTIAHSAKLPIQNPVHDNHVPVHHHDHAVDSKPVGIVHQESEVLPDGSFHNVWESENGIKVQEEATVKVLAKNTIAHTVNGKIAYTDYDGNLFTLTYVADETGFHPEGEHLPTPPPIPQAIARALEYIAAHPPPKDSSFHSDSATVEDN